MVQDLTSGSNTKEHATLQCQISGNLESLNLIFRPVANSTDFDLFHIVNMK
jgi:hypothetical protein